MNYYQCKYYLSLSLLCVLQLPWILFMATNTGNEDSTHTTQLVVKMMYAVKGKTAVEKIKQRRMTFSRLCYWGEKPGCSLNSISLKQRTGEVSRSRVGWESYIGHLCLLFGLTQRKQGGVLEFGAMCPLELGSYPLTETG